MSSLLKELEALNAPVTEIPDIEDYNFDNAVKKKSKTSHDDSGAEDGDEITIQRRRIAGAVELNDVRYKGEKVSRAELFGDSTEMSGMKLKKNKRKVSFDSDDDGEDDDDDDEEEEDEEEDGDEEESGDDEEDEEEEASEGNNEDDDDDVEDEEEEKISMNQLVQPVKEDDEKKKGESVRKQLDMCEQVLLLHIKAHGAMRAYNQMARGDQAKALAANADEKTRTDMNEAHKNALRLVSVLLEAEEILLEGSTQTKGILTKKDAKKEGDDGELDSDDEEIESSEDEDDKKKKDEGEKAKNGKDTKSNGKKKAAEEEDEEEDDEDMDDDDGSIPDYNVSGTDNDSDADDEQANKGKKKANKVSDLPLLRRRAVTSEVRFEQFRSNTLSKWDQRTRLVSMGGNAKQKKGDFSAFDGDILKQIDKILADKSRLVARTQTKRSDHERIGGDAEATHDPEIFDDDDFYQMLLRDLIERKSAVDTTDPIAMSRQWLELEKLRQKRSKKKKVDTKASKGRKIRYTAIPKLVNYHAAVPECVAWSHEMRNELFKSLFK